MIDTSGTERSPAAIETAAWFVADQPGWIERTLARCVPNAHGDCAGCGSYRPVRWPCTQVWIAHTAQRLIRERAKPSAVPRREAPATPTRCATTPKKAPA